MPYITTSLMLAISILIAPLVNANVITGEVAPNFTLTDTSGNPQTLSGYKGKFVVLEWFNHDCPFVKKHYDGGNMQSLQKEFTAKDVIWLSINSSAVGKQGNYSPDEAAKLSAIKGVASTAVLLDPDGNVGKLYGAKTTPHMYIINPDGNLIYQGAIDDKASADAADIDSSKNYVKVALEEALAGNPVTEATTKSYGCSVKY